jgi:hypothetical protein
MIRPGLMVEGLLQDCYTVTCGINQSGLLPLGAEKHKILGLLGGSRQDDVSQKRKGSGFSRALSRAADQSGKSIPTRLPLASQERNQKYLGGVTHSAQGLTVPGIPRAVPRLDPPPH